MAITLQNYPEAIKPLEQAFGQETTRAKRSVNFDHAQALMQAVNNSIASGTYDPAKDAGLLAGKEGVLYQLKENALAEKKAEINRRKMETFSNVKDQIYQNVYLQTQADMVKDLMNKQLGMDRTELNRSYDLDARMRKAGL